MEHPTKTRFVTLYTWYRSASGTRSFCVVEKLGKGTGADYRTTDVKLVEHLKHETILYDVEEFFALIDAGHLVEVKP